MGRTEVVGGGLVEAGLLLPRPIPAAVNPEGMDGMMEETAEIVEVPVREGSCDGWGIFQVGGKPGIDGGESGADPGPVECKVVCSGLPVEGSKGLLDHVPAVDTEIGCIQSLTIDDYLESRKAVGRCI